MIEGGFFYARRTTNFLDYGSRNRGLKPRKPAIIRPMTIPSELLRQCWFLAGPTASGKTATSIELAKRLNGEVLSLDSMAIYRRMDIGTAKPTVEERAGIPHHLIDIVDPHEEFSTADFLNHAEQAIRDILSRNKTPLFAGGTGLYLRSLLRGVFEGPAADWDFRRELEAEESQAPGSLWAKLEQRDPTTAARLHPNDQRRIVRALEVHHLTGQPLSAQQQQGPLPLEDRPEHVYWIHPPRPWLADRINRRVDLMVEAGLVAEVDALLKAEPPAGRTARQGLGYKEVIAHLEEGQPLDETIEQIKTRTRQFAKRQHTWFRNMEECQEFAISGEESAAELADRLLQISRTIDD